MKLWVNPVGFEHAKKIIVNKNVDYVIVGIGGKLSTRNTCLLTLEQIGQINSPKLAVSLNNLYVDDQLNELTNVLKQLKEINVRNIIFTDFAVKQICDEITYQPEFIYNSETLITNYSQLPFYKEHGLNEVVLPRELFLPEILEFCKFKSNVKLQMQAEGYGLMMHSK
ncbi:MAG: U32 family peptidase [Mycoplasmoidaceae bacterium]|nr:U32 family peptidase [Mycoplasmoidaceae bacterium]